MNNPHSPAGAVNKVEKSGDFIRQIKTKRAGVVFVLLVGGSDGLNRDCVCIEEAALACKATVMSMVSGLIQIVVAGEDEAAIEGQTEILVGDIISGIRQRGVTAWTIEECAIGLWGDKHLHYGALLPDTQKILAALGAAKPGEAVRI